MRLNIAPLGLTLRAACAALFLCVACSGSAPSTGTIIPITTLRTDLKFGYYFGNALFMGEQTDHANLWWSIGLTPGEVDQAWAFGYKNLVLSVSADPAILRPQLLALRDHVGAWDSVTLYPLDEPEKLYTDEQVTAIIDGVRRVALDTGFAFAQVGVFYGCARAERPGIRSYDRVGCFRYDSTGCAKLETDYQGLRELRAPTAKLWLIPGGADINGKEGQQDPACWASYAHRTPDVWGVIPFMWQSGADPNNSIIGIRDIPMMKKLYCETGRTILGTSIVGC